MVGRISHAMNFFIRLWYSIYEFTIEKSAFKDTPLGGTSFIITILLEFIGIAICGYWSCFHHLYPSIPKPFEVHTRLQVALALIPPFCIVLIFCKKIAMHWIERFLDESEKERRKRHKEAIAFSIGFVCFFAGWVIWRWHQP